MASSKANRLAPVAIAGRVQQQFRGLFAAAAESGSRRRELVQRPTFV
jgi:hypothetical protein